MKTQIHPTIDSDILATAMERCKKDRRSLPQYLELLILNDNPAGIVTPRPAFHPGFSHAPAPSFAQVAPVVQRHPNATTWANDHDQIDEQKIVNITSLEDLTDEVMMDLNEAEIYEVGLNLENFSKKDLDRWKRMHGRPVIEDVI